MNCTLTSWFRITENVIAKDRKPKKYLFFPTNDSIFIPAL